MPSASALNRSRLLSRCSNASHMTSSRRCAFPESHAAPASAPPLTPVTRRGCIGRSRPSRVRNPPCQKQRSPPPEKTSWSGSVRAGWVMRARSGRSRGGSVPPRWGDGSGGYGRSRHMATPMPPPMHSVARPFFEPRRCISNSRVFRIRAPEAPIGWPMAMAPPFTFTMDGSQPISLLTAQACAAKASFASTRSRSSAFQPALSSALREAKIGPTPMIDGSSPAVAYEAMRASGVRPRFSASSADISNTAAAPSLMPDALAAVTEPSLVKAGRSFCIASIVAPWRMYSSASTTVSPLRDLMVKGITSSLNLPAFWAASALFWLATANSSCCSREICHCSATFSAVWPMW
eukprot:m.258924 g.258924  ORF g.258924 m.258924 type:complete len:349 (+) comp32889_c0_seq1:304-1350(+)